MQSPIAGVPTLFGATDIELNTKYLNDENVSKVSVFINYHNLPSVTAAKRQKMSFLKNRK